MCLVPCTQDCTQVFSSRCLHAKHSVLASFAYEAMQETHVSVFIELAILPTSHCVHVVWTGLLWVPIEQSLQFPPDFFHNSHCLVQLGMVCMEVVWNIFYYLRSACTATRLPTSIGPQTLRMLGALNLCLIPRSSQGDLGCGGPKTKVIQKACLRAPQVMS